MGPVPMIEGSSPAWPQETILAIGSMPRFSASAALISTTAAAPSLMPEALPAVTVPSFRSKAGRSFARFSTVTPSLMYSSWSTTITASCADEDVNRDGILQPAEDFNSSGRIEAGNIASISAQGTGGGTLTTDANGFGFADLFYPQEYAYYLDTILQATVADVGGTEFAEALNVTLTGAASDFNNQNVAPPGLVSPFGTSGTCADTL